MHPNALQTPITYLKGVGPGRAALLGRELGIETYQDLLYFFPNRYIDKSRFYKISELERTGAEVQIIGRITHIKTVAQKKGKRLVATFKDDTGSLELVWFRGQKWIQDRIKLNEPYVIFGRTNYFNGSFSMPHPEIELLSQFEGQKRIVMQPVYPSTEKLSN